MLKLYNESTKISSNLSEFFKNINTNISKPHLNLVSSIIPSIISAESVVTSDIAKKLQNHFPDIQFSSITRKLERFFNNDKFDQYFFYHSIISYINILLKIKMFIFLLTICFANLLLLFFFFL